MMSSLLQLATVIVRTWTRLYTLGLEPALRDARRAEIDSDLWEFQQDFEGDKRLNPAAHVLARLLIGIPQDLCWRVEHHAVGGGRALQGIAAQRLAREPHVTFTAFACSLTLHAFAGMGAVWLASLPMERPISAIQARYMNGAAGPSFSPAAAGVGTAAEARERIAMMVNRQNGEKPTTWAKLLSGIAVAASPVFMGALPSPWLDAQSLADAGAPAFEVASVKPDISGLPQTVPPVQPGGRFTMIDRTLRELILLAYSPVDDPLQNSQIDGGPDWIASDRFDIVAKMSGNPQLGKQTVDQSRLMLRTLLAERFKLVAHIEKRDLPVYALVLARSDGRLGPRLRRSEANCDRGPTPLAAIPGPNAPLPPCGYLATRPGGVTFRGVSMVMLGRMGLSRSAGRIVVDRTGLTGAFDIDLEWTPDQLPQAPLPPGAPPLPPINPNGPSIFTALQEQLGLKLEPQRAPIDILVIDSAEQPTVN